MIKFKQPKNIPTAYDPVFMLNWAKNEDNQG